MDKQAEVHVPRVILSREAAHVKAALEAPVLANLQAQLQTLELRTPYDIDIYLMYYRMEFTQIYNELYKKYSE